MTVITARNIVDLTHTLSERIPSFDGDCCFTLGTVIDYEDCDGTDRFRVQRIDCKAGAGTHMDAPAHCFAGAASVDALSLKSLITDCVVIRIENADEHHKIMPNAVEAFEGIHGKIPANAFVIFDTGWSKHWNEPERYRNRLRFPSVDESTAILLLTRGIAGIGIDTLSPDAGGADYPVHRAVLGAGKYLVENVANAAAIPVTGAKILIMPMKIENGTEAPVRLVALFD